MDNRRGFWASEEQAERNIRPFSICSGVEEMLGGWGWALSRETFTFAYWITSWSLAAGRRRCVRLTALQQNRMTDPTFNKAFQSWISKHSNLHKHPKVITQHQIAAQSCCYQSNSQLSFDYQREHRKLSCITGSSTHQLSIYSKLLKLKLRKN